MNFDYLKRFLDHMTDGLVPGASVVVGLGGREVFRYEAGYAELERKTPMTADHLLFLYSCSKVTTVTAALQLYEQAKFLLDDPVYDYIPEFKDVSVRQSDGSAIQSPTPITFRHLFTMTAGVDYDLGAYTSEAKAEGCETPTTLDVVRRIAKRPLCFTPGDHFQYSLCHDILAAVVEVISGRKFRDYVHENIFEPLGMNHAYYHADGHLDQMADQYRFDSGVKADIADLQAGKYHVSDGVIVNVGKQNSHIVSSEYDSGGAGIVTSVAEYHKLCAALANGGRLPDGEQILSPGTIDLLRTPQLTAKQAESFNWPQLKGYNYGLGVRTLADKALSGTTGNVGEFGWGGAAGATVLVDPSIGLSVFYAHHMLNPREDYYQPRLRNVVYACL